MRIWANIKKCCNEFLNSIRACLLGFTKFLFDFLVEILVGLRRLFEEVVAILKVIASPIITGSFKILIERVLTYSIISLGCIVVLSKLQKLLN